MAENNSTLEELFQLYTSEKSKTLTPALSPLLNELDVIFEEETKKKEEYINKTLNLGELFNQIENIDENEVSLKSSVSSHDETTVSSETVSLDEEKESSASSAEPINETVAPAVNVLDAVITKKSRTKIKNLSYCGEYDPTAKYSNGDMVTYDYAVWICVKNNTKTVYPGTGNNWLLFVAKPSPQKQPIYKGGGGGDTTMTITVSMPELKWGFMYNGTPTLTTITSINTPVKVAGTTIAPYTMVGFTHSSNNRLTYTGLSPVIVNIIASVTISANIAGSRDEFSLYIAKNGNISVPSRCVMDITSANDHLNGSCVDRLTLNTNDYIELFVENNTDDADVTIDDFILRITE